MTAVAAAAVILASFSEFSLARGVAWFAAAAGAVIVVALAGTLTRLPRLQAGTGATLLALAGAAPLVAARPVAVKMGALPLLACCAASIRWPRHFRVVADLATYLSALLIYLTVVFARAQAFALFVPTTGVIRQLGALARAGAALTAYAPPVPGTPGVALLAAGGIGLAAVVVDIIAVRLRRPALTGLPLLAVYIAPIASAAKVGGLGGLVAFALAASGYLALLSAEGRDRLRGWGALVTVWHQVGEDDRLGGADVAPLAATGRRIGLAAVCAAALAPLILPSLHLPRLLNGAGGGGIQPVAVGLPDPVVQLHSQLSREKPEPVLTYRARGAGQDDYLQIYVLNYDPSRGSWVLIRPDAGSQVGAGPMQPPPGLAPGTPVLSRTLTVTLGPVGRGYSWPIFFLPVPYWPQRLQVAGSWREANGTLMVYSGTTDPAGLRYTVTSGQPVVTGAELAADASLPVPPAIARDYLGFRSPLAGLLRGIADRVTRGQSSAFGRAVALERWFQSARFGYSLRSDLPDTAQGLLTFLTTDRRGNCQQFAFAMAVLARLVGIPSRIAVGYTGGTPERDGTWLVTTADAHAWPELYFPGLGWLRFEPTPAGPQGAGTATQPSYVTSPASGGSSPGQGSGPGPGGSQQPSPGSATFIRGRLRTAAGGSGHVTAVAPDHGPGPAPAALAAALALLAAVAVAPGAARLAARRLRWKAASGNAGLAHAAWAELRADLEDVGMPCRDSDSPRAVARRVSAAVGEDEAARRAVRRIAEIVERARYAQVPAPADGLRADVRLVRRSLCRAAGPARRWRARLLPASALNPVLAALRGAAGLLTGWAPVPPAGRGEAPGAGATGRPAAR